MTKPNSSNNRKNNNNSSTQPLQTPYSSSSTNTTSTLRSTTINQNHIQNNHLSTTPPSEKLKNIQHPSPNHHHHSRLTRFLFKFTTSSIHSKRKTSLPNLNHPPQSTSIDPCQVSSKRSLSHYLPNHPHSTLKPNSISLQPLLSLPTISDQRSSCSDQIPHLNQSSTHFHHNPPPTTDFEDGADPNASIRPLTPSSKAVSIVSPNDARTAITDMSSLDPPEHDSPTYSRDLERRYGRRKPSSNSSCSSEPDDCKSTFGNSSLASTKPTTVVSVENPPGNRIAQPHPSPILHSTMAQPSMNPRNRVILNHHRVQSASSNSAHPTTSALTLLSSPTSLQNHTSIINVPTHSLPHPSQNPHPAALADNASILTLASSGFSPSLHNNQHFQLDEDASVRALAPSRRESIESLSSRWSNVKSTRTTGTGTNFFTGISSHVNSTTTESPIANGNEAKEDVDRPDKQTDENDPRVESMNNLADRSEFLSSSNNLGVPSMGLVNG